MTPTEIATGPLYRKLIQQLGLDQTEAAILLGVDARTSRKWANNERPLTPTAMRFLRYLLAQKVSGREAIKILELATSK